MYWGYHFIGNFGKCLPYSIRCGPHIIDFSKRLVRDIDMVAYGEPQLQHFGSGNKAGYTLVQLIETSNICAHFVEETDDIYLDVFSCKTFDPKIVEKLVKHYFEPQYSNFQVLNRQAKNGPNKDFKELE
jgi:S-adenosylmethionine/arginine decarboxylase-like enzyme